MTPASAPLRRRTLRAVRAQWALLLALLLLALAALDASGLAWRLDLALYDAAQRGRPAPADVVIVAIDDASVASIGRWPWRRAVHATLLARLRAAGVRGVALDVIFAEPEREPALPARAAPGAGSSGQAVAPSGAVPPAAAGDGDRDGDGDGDSLLAAALRAGPPTVLPLVATPLPGMQGLAELPPIEPLASAAAALGHAQVEIDADGIARSVFLREGRGAPQHPHFALALLERVAPAELAPLRVTRHPDLAHAPADAWVRDQQLLVPFLGPPGHFTTLSYVDALRGAIEPARLRGKWVLVGATAQGLGDAYATPLSRGGRTTPGVELSANVLQALRDGSGILPAPRALRLALGALPLLLAFAGFLWLSPRQSLLLLAALWVATLAAAWLALQLGWWWPPAAALVVLTAAYPLWNWRRLEATQRFLDVEFTRLMAERMPLARETAPAIAAPRGGDALQRRIELVEAATARLRDLRRLLSDTIANLPDAALVIDRGGRVVLANPAAGALLRDPRDAPDGRGRVDVDADAGAGAGADAAPTTATATLVDAPLAALLDATFGADAIDVPALLGTELLALEARTPARGTARARDLLLRAAPFHDDGGTRLGTILTLTDVSGLRDAQRERDELVGFLSHDIRSPASSLLALTRLQRDPARALAPEAFAARAEALAQRSLELADGFLALARAEAIGRESFEPFDLRDALQDAIDETWAAARERGVALSLTAGDDTPWRARGHRGLVARALANLLGNAIRHAPQGSTVSLDGRRDGREWELRVVDAGPGIEPELRGRLFGRFQRGAAAAGRRGRDLPQPQGGGIGLGLAFVRVVATRHGGSTGVRDRADGQGGSEFFLRVPVDETPPA